MNTIVYIVIALHALGLYIITPQPNKIEALVNTERTSQNLPALRSSELLRESACLKATDMAEKDYFAHDAPDGTEPWHYFKEVGYDYKTAGENLARNYKDEQSTVKAWMNSPTHRDNILDDYTEQGICTVDEYTVQHLGKK